MMYQRNSINPIAMVELDSEMNLLVRRLFWNLLEPGRVWKFSDMFGRLFAQWVVNIEKGVLTWNFKITMD